MTFTTLLLGVLIIFVFSLVVWKLMAVFFSPYFVCRLPEKLGLVDLKLNAGNCNSFCVYCASEESLYNFFNLFPWESRGILSFKDDEICYEGAKYNPSFFRKLRKQKRKAPRVRHYFNKQRVKITYMPPSLWRDGGLTWMRLEIDEIPFYFTTGRSRLGVTDIDSERVAGLYELVSEIR